MDRMTFYLLKSLQDDMTEDSDDNDLENKVVDEGSKTTAEATPTVGSASVKIDFSSWIRGLKEDAQEALQVWEKGGDISPPNSEDVVVFFIISSTHIEELSARALHKGSHQKELQNVVNQKRGNPPTIGTSLDDFRDVRQYEREIALERASILSNSEKQYLEHTRWIRNQIAHSRDGSVKADDLEQKFAQNGRKFNPSNIPEQTIKGISKIESSL